ncbi:putative T complex chaperonin [Cardiosporidium cionae]|uniref:T complex chaperonin n=1 Tax=Cardiosporidium cionae TaxID=476202 RepID=A0ABQ7JA39_9APIC|nr:putative T complex chaperonin [Cardiosporidium cionae]|eukprot:KAF8820834.1 putative T complex chaperonin [Cardiosporidium cionae]
MFANRHGLSSLLKEGGKVLSGVEEVALKNIEACRYLSTITQTSLGPNSMNKLIVNRLEKRFVTSDAAVMISELEVEHPAAKLLIQAAKMQENEFGDFTNFVLTFGGELLNQAEALIKQGLHTADISKGYETAITKCLEYLNEASCWEIKDVRNPVAICEAIKPVIASKQGSTDGKIFQLVAETVALVLPPNLKDFNTENIRVAQLIGGSIDMSYSINGMVILRDSEGNIKKKKNPKVLILSCGLEITGTEATSTVLLKNAQELLDFTKGEEHQMETLISGIQQAGVGVIISNGAISEIAQHYCNKYDILTLRVPSKHEIRRLCRSLGAVALVRLGVPLPEEIGVAESVEVQEIASKKVTVIRAKDSRVGTIVLRGATKNVLDEVERAIDDSISCVKSFLNDPKFVAGAGAIEIHLAHKLQELGSNIPGLDQYAVLKFATALECIPKIIASNAGYNPTEAITKLYAAHQQGEITTGINITGPSMILDAKTEGIFDHKETKFWAIKLAVDAVLTILRVDQILMAKPAGGPAPPAPGAPDLD